MCGIFGLLNNNVNVDVQDIMKSFEKGSHRGPEFSIYKKVMMKTDFGFHRLAINGLDEISHQPIILDDIVLICNGEIYNYKELYKMMNITPKTNSDCEVIIHLYKNYGIKQTLQMIDGVFAFCLLDMRLDTISSNIYFARDPYGVRPLYIMHSEKTGSKTLPDTYVASELKMLTDIYKSKYQLCDGDYFIEQFRPGTYTHYTMIHKVCANWEIVENYIPYHETAFTSCSLLNDSISVDSVYKNIQHYLINAVEKRCFTTDRPIACLLSGGLDSSLITSLVNEHCKKNNMKNLETYSIGIEGSDDLKYAKVVADYLGTKHTEIVLQEKDFLDCIPDVIYDIESYDTTTVRASIGNWLIGKYISQNSDAKVIFNGDGSDELTGGYLYVGSANDEIEYDKECRRLLKDIHTFDVLRSDKCISSHGLEPRTPFLDREWVQFYLSIPFHIRCKLRSKESSYTEKELLRNAFHIDHFQNTEGKQLLPNEILYRQKEAFSDGVSKQTRSLYEITQEHATNYINTHILKEVSDFIPNTENNIPYIIRMHPTFSFLNNHLLPDTAEKLYYRFLFEKYYSGLGKIIPYFWMPKYVETNDASARTLKIYK